MTRLDVSYHNFASCKCLLLTALLVTLAVTSVGAEQPMKQMVAAEGVNVESKLADADLVIAYTGMTRGTFEPCGCGGVHEGGLSRRATVIDKLRRQGKPLLLVDTGDLCNGFRKVQLRYMLQAYQLMGYDAVLLGPRDLRVGLEVVFKAAQQSQVPLLLSNVSSRDPRWAERIKDHVIIKKGGMRIGMVGLMGHARFRRLPKAVQEKLVFTPPQQALEQTLAKLKDRAELVVLLSYFGGDDEQAKTLQAKGVNLWIDTGAYRRPRLGKPATRSRIRSKREPLPIGDLAASPPLLVCRDNDRALPVAAVRLRGNNRLEVLNVEVLPINKPIAQQQKFLDIYQAYKFANTLQMRISPTWRRRSSYAQVRFVPAESCRQCHQQQYDFWKDTAHARSFATLQHEKRDDDMNCWPCHSTGFGEKGGFVDMKQTPYFGVVGCQMCHRVDPDNHPASKPAVAHAKARIARPPRPRDMCRICHIQERSPRFNPRSYTSKIACPKMAEPTAQPATQPVAAGRR